MTDKKDPTDPSNTSRAYEYMLPKWQMIDTLVGGTSAMRAAGPKYLPQHPEESSDNYRNRLEMTTLYNMVDLTLDALVGKPFSEPVEVSENVPAQITELFDDLDLQGNSINTVARDWFRGGLKNAFHHLLIDMPSLTQDERAGRTLEDDIRDNRRPYWVLIDPANVFFCYSEVVDGEEQITHMRYYEEHTEMDGFVEVVKHRIRVLEPGSFSVYELRRPKGKRKEQWVLIDSGETGINRVPVVTYYANKTDHMMGKPPLEDLAYLNVRHWQSTSDQINILTVSRYPMLAASGMVQGYGDDMAVGPRQLLSMRDPQGRFYYVEHSGKAINAGRQDILDLEDQMSAYGAEFLRRQPNGQTATSRALDSAESMSSLEDHVVRFEDAMQKALRLTAEWMGLDDGGDVVVNKDFYTSETVQTQLKGLLEARKMGDLSREEFLQALKLLDILSDDFDPVKNLVNLRMEMAAANINNNNLNSQDILGNNTGENDDISDPEEERDED